MKNAIRSFFPALAAVCLLALAQAQAVFATTYATEQDGNWSDAATWVANGKPPNPLPAGDIIQINHKVEVDLSYHAAGRITINPDGSLKILAGKTLTHDDNLLQNGDSLVVAGTLRDIGDVIVPSGKTLEISSGGKLIIEATDELILNGTLDNKGNVESKGVLKGAGTILQNGAFKFLTGSKISPGNDGPGKLTITGNIDLGEAKVECQINGNTPDKYDQIAISGIKYSPMQTQVFVAAWGAGFTPSHRLYIKLITLGEMDPAKGPNVWIHFPPMPPWSISSIDACDITGGRDCYAAVKVE